MEINMEQAKGWLDKATKEAQEVINNPSKIDEILIQLEEKLKTVPAIGETLSDLPLMIAMVKAWIKKEYTEVSPKVIACLVGAFIYLIKKDDLINDTCHFLQMTEGVFRGAGHSAACVGFDRKAPLDLFYFAFQGGKTNADSSPRLRGIPFSNRRNSLHRSPPYAGLHC